VADKKIKMAITGIAVWPKLDKPDVYQPMKNGKPNGEKKVRYTTDLKLEDEALAKFEDALKKIAKKQLPDCEHPKLPIKKSKKTGERTVTMASGEKYRPPVFDAQNNKVPPSVVIGGGSLIKVQVTVNPYDGFGGGINLYIDAIQLLKLEQNERTSPFEKDPSGYSYSGGEDADEEGTAPDHNADEDDGTENYEF